MNGHHVSCGIVDSSGLCALVSTFQQFALGGNFMVTYDNPLANHDLTHIL